MLRCTYTLTIVHRCVLLLQQMHMYYQGAALQPVVSSVTAPKSESGSIQKGRLYSLDAARFVAMIMMMQGHVLDALVRPDVLDIAVFPWSWWHSIRGLTAPVFLMVSGAVHVFATKRNADGSIRDDVISKRLRWAFTILGIAYLLVFPADRIWDLPFVPDNAWYAVTAVNILHLTAATLILFILVMASTRSVAQMGRRAFIAAIVLLALSPLAGTVPWELHMPLWVAAYLTPNTGSLFPMWPFSAYLFVGVAIGVYLVRVPATVRDAHIARYAWPVGVVVVCLALAIREVLLAYGVSYDDLENSTSAVLALRRIGIVLVVFSAVAAVVRFLYRWKDAITFFSSKSLHFYIVHLVLLFGTPWFDSIGRTHARSFDLIGGIALAVGIIVVTIGFVAAIDRLGRLSVPPIISVFVKGAMVATMCYLLLV